MSYPVPSPIREAVGLGRLLVSLAVEAIVDETWGRWTTRLRVRHTPSGLTVYTHERRRWPWGPWGPA